MPSQPRDNAVNALALFASTFVLVFALGIQQLNVSGRHFAAAFFTSILISAGNLVLFKLAPNSTGIEIVAYLLGGSFGIIVAMTAHPWLVKRWGARR